MAETEESMHEQLNPEGPPSAKKARNIALLRTELEKMFRSPLTNKMMEDPYILSSTDVLSLTVGDSYDKEDIQTLKEQFPENVVEFWPNTTLKRVIEHFHSNNNNNLSLLP